MPITQTHEIHRRRFGRNVGVAALCLVAFCAIVFGLTIAKVQPGQRRWRPIRPPAARLGPAAGGELNECRPSDNSRTARRLLLVVAGMVALTASAVPLYDLFCRVTGYGGTTQVASTGQRP